jgi:hypothetical protein
MAVNIVVMHYCRAATFEASFFPQFRGHHFVGDGVQGEVRFDCFLHTCVATG